MLLLPCSTTLCYRPKGSTVTNCVLPVQKPNGYHISKFCVWPMAEDEDYIILPAEVECYTGNKFCTVMPVYIHVHNNQRTLQIVC